MIHTIKTDIFVILIVILIVKIFVILFVKIFVLLFGIIFVMISIFSGRLASLTWPRTSTACTVDLQVRLAAIGTCFING